MVVQIISVDKSDSLLSLNCVPAKKAARNLLVRILESIKSILETQWETVICPSAKQWCICIQNILWSSWVRICNTREQRILHSFISLNMQIICLDHLSIHLIANPTSVGIRAASLPLGIPPEPQASVMPENRGGMGPKSIRLSLLLPRHLCCVGLGQPWSSDMC